MIKTRILKLAHGILDDRASANDGAGIRAKEEQRRQMYVEKARMRCRGFRELRYCTGCHIAFETIHSFCDRCTDATEPLPSTYALEYACAEFPDLVATREDFDRLVG